MTRISCFVLILLAEPALAQWLSEPQQQRFQRLWETTGVEFPEGMKAYKPTELSQRIAITNNRESHAWYPKDKDDVWSNAPVAVNPNRIFPWAVPGGLHKSVGWNHTTGIYLPSQPKVWSEKLPIKNGGKITGLKWEYPDGTVTADMLTHLGKVFELRVRSKVDGKWESSVVFRDKLVRPTYFVGAGKVCSECHDKAGSSLQYGIVLRGSDTVFSYLPRK